MKVIFFIFSPCVHFHEVIIRFLVVGILVVILSQISEMERCFRSCFLVLTLVTWQVIIIQVWQERNRMLKKISNGFQQSIFNAPQFAIFLAVLGGLVFVYQLWVNAHAQYSHVDEAAYAIKGLWFATGKFTPYQEYGPWTNHMPLSFLIPGI